jgi:hypothetical protein
MKLESPYFDMLRAKPRTRRAAFASMRQCEWPGCDHVGAHRAPKGRGREGEFYHYCVEHVRLYNRQYDYFDGMSDEEVIQFQRASITGHRPTWNVASGRASVEKSTRAGFDWAGFGFRFGITDPFELSGDVNARAAPHWPHGRPLQNADRKCLRILGLDETADAKAIREHFKMLVMRHHPDQNGGDRSSEDKLREVIQAYKYLKKAGLC